jgi:putative transposase
VPRHIASIIPMHENLLMHHSRKLNRKRSYNYSNSGIYFVTFCTKNRMSWFGEISNKRMCLNNLGHIANEYWLEIPQYYKNVKIDEFIIMPDHVHGIVIIERNVGTYASNHIHYGLLSKIIKSYKNAVTKYLRYELNIENFSWQRSFYDRIIYNENDLNNVMKYIRDNDKRVNYD